MKKHIFFMGAFLAFAIFGSADLAFAAVDTTAAVFGVEEAGVAVMDVMGVMLSLAVAIYGVSAVLEFIRGESH